MDRQDRRRHLLRERNEAGFDPLQRRVESAARGRTARRIRGHLRRLEPVALVTPRWTAPQALLEDIALDLAVSDPGVGCRTISLRPMMGRSVPEAWNFVLRVMGELIGPAFATRPVPVVCDRRGFIYAAESLLAMAQEESPRPVALLAHGTEHLPVEVLTDLATVWSKYAEEARDSRRCALLLAGAVETPAFHLNPLPPIELGDFGEAEAAAALFARVGSVAPAALQRAVMLSGGMPAIVHEVGRAALRASDRGPSTSGGFLVARRTQAEINGVPTDPEGILRAIGPLADDLRASVSSAMMNLEVAGRFFSLSEQGALAYDPERDDPLLRAGLARRSRCAGGAGLVELRSPVLPLLAS